MFSLHFEVNLSPSPTGSLRRQCRLRTVPFYIAGIVQSGVTHSHPVAIDVKTVHTGRRYLRDAKNRARPRASPLTATGVDAAVP